MPTREYGRIEAEGNDKKTWRVIRYNRGGSLYGGPRQTVIARNVATRDRAVEILQDDIAKRKGIRRMKAT